MVRSIEENPNCKPGGTLYEECFVCFVAGTSCRSHLLVAYHGTECTALRSIVQHGFANELNGTRVGQAYGAGIGNKMLVCELLVPSNPDDNSDVRYVQRGDTSWIVHRCSTKILPRAILEYMYD